jgi:hypothetical protein
MPQAPTDWQLLATAWRRIKKRVVPACVAGSFLAWSQNRTVLLTICAVEAQGLFARNDWAYGVVGSDYEKRSKKTRRVTPAGCARRGRFVLDTP